jgi:protein required for attachment to host cells
MAVLDGKQQRMHQNLRDDREILNVSVVQSMDFAANHYGRGKEKRFRKKA